MQLIRPKKVFIVDDDFMTAELLKDTIQEKAAHQVSIFETGEDCFSALPQKPDVVILDYHLNSNYKDAANGLEILQLIHKNYPSIKIYMLSSQQHYAIAMQTMQKGATEYFIKEPQAFTAIAAAINEMR